MKIKIKPKKLGRKSKLGGYRLNFYPGTDLNDAMEKIEERRKKLKLPFAFTKSYIAREGIGKMLEHLTTLMDRAEGGDLHAKRRVRKLGIKPKQNNETEIQKEN